MIETILETTVLTTAYVTDFIGLDRSDVGNKPQLESMVIQGFWAGADDTDATIEIWYTLDRAKAVSNGMETASGSPVTLSAASGTFAFPITNLGYNACRLKYTPVSVVTLGTLCIYKGHK
jgi:hypothetical protein